MSMTMARSERERNLLTQANLTELVFNSEVNRNVSGQFLIPKVYLAGK